MSSESCTSDLKIKIEEKKSLLELIREKRIENLKLERKTNSLKSESEVLAKENEEFLGYLENKKKYIEDNIIDLYDFYNEKEGKIMKEKYKLKKDLEEHINELEAKIELKKTENLALEEKAKNMSGLIKQIEEQNEKVESLKKQQQTKQAENQRQLFDLIDKYNHRSNIESAKKSIEGKRLKYKEIAMEYLRGKVHEAVERNKNLKRNFVQLKNINKKICEEESKVAYHKLELEREKLFREKVEKELKNFS